MNLSKDDCYSADAIPRFRVLVAAICAEPPDPRAIGHFRTLFDRLIWHQVHQVALSWRIGRPDLHALDREGLEELFQEIVTFLLTGVRRSPVGHKYSQRVCPLRSWLENQRADGRLSSFVATAATNYARDLLRGEAALRKRLLPPSEGANHSDREDLESTLDRVPVAEYELDVAERREIREVVRTCIDQMPEPMRQIALLVLVDGGIQAQAASRCGVSEATVSRHLWEAREQLQKALVDLDPILVERYLNAATWCEEDGHNE